MICAAALLSPFSASARAPRAGDWEAAPSREDLQRALPPLAKAHLDGGRAVVSCRLATDRTLGRCRVVAEHPQGLGYGDALLSLAPQFRLKAQTTPSAQEDVVVVHDWYRHDTRPDWLTRPTPADLLSVWPIESLRATGKAVVNCTVTAQGALTSCVSIEEEPAGSGFGRAAITLLRQLDMQPATHQGRRTPSSVNIPIDFARPPLRRQDTWRLVAPAGLPWAETPSLTDIAAAYPDRARAEKVVGRVLLRCRVGYRDRLTCAAIRETPDRYGFGAAAEALAKRFQLDASADPDVRQQSIHVRVTFDPAALDDQSVAGEPLWIRRPTPQEIATALAPLGAGAPVRLTLRCVVAQDGRLKNCTAPGAQPAERASAALSLADKFVLSAWSEDGFPMVGGVVHVPLRYDPDEEV